MVKWEKTANEFTIIQGEISPLVFIVLFLVGAIFTLIGACGMILQLLYLLVDSSLSVKVFLVMGIFSFIGMVALGIGLKLKKENLAEEIVFANKQETVFFRRHRQAQPFYQLDYADVSHIHTYMEKRHTSYSNSSSNTYIYYIIYLIKKDGAEIWLTQFISDLLSFQTISCRTS